MNYEVDLEKIGSDFLDIRRQRNPNDELQTYGKPQVVFDALKINLKGEPQWSLQPVGNMKTQTVNYDAYRRDLYSELTVSNSSVLGNSFTIRRGLVKGINKKLTIPVTGDWQTKLNQTFVDLYPGQTETDSKQKVNLSLDTSHQINVMSSRSVAKIDVTERHFKGTVSFRVRLKGNVLFLRGSGSPISELDISQIVNEVKQSGRSSANNVYVEHKKGLPKNFETNKLMEGAVDLRTIVREYVDIRNQQWGNQDPIQEFGTPQIVLDALKIGVRGQSKWKLSLLPDMKTQKVEYDAFRQGLYSEVVADSSSVLGNTFTIDQGQVLGFNKKLSIPVPDDLEHDLVNQTYVDIYPGLLVTDSKQKLKISLASSHVMPESYSGLSKSVANVDIEKKHYQGLVSFQVEVQGVVLLYRGNGDKIDEMDIAQIVEDVMRYHPNSDNIKDVEVDYETFPEQLPKSVFWNMQITADILCDFTQKLVWK
ncbi:hypothetical protein Bpfe_017182 [Biomphalaria pfeifferi]|uniref:Uncharacterized protein n=1 Tax=Biomphalaria pfeifferi TaxID=112525 RepID=A0AAD8BGV3_BIOPF|nr:hypothetical protein Bpfe_017182 [Biomphalaria pfeifferi]